MKTILLTGATDGIGLEAAKLFAQANGAYFDNDIGTFSKPHPFSANQEARLTLMTFLDTLL